MIRKALVLGVVALGLTACQGTREDRTLAGGALGAGTGAVIGGLATNSVGGAVAGGVIGGAAGAIIGNSSGDSRPAMCEGYDSRGRRVRYEC